MKLKGISTVEQHFEKAVVGGTGLILLGVLGVQFLTQPNMITVGKSQPVPPGEAYRPVEEAARALQAKLDPDSGKSLVPEEPKVDLLSQYQQKIAAGVTPRPQIAMLGPAINLGGAAPPTRSATNQPITMAPLPAPISPAVYAYAATIDPYEALRIKELKSVLPAEQPYDKQWVSVEATFDGTALKAALESDPDGDGPARAVPRGWFENTLEIVGVQMEREKLSGDSLSAAINGQLDPSAEWSEPTLVAPLPGTVDVVGEMIASVKTMTDLAGALARARENGETVLRPEFFQTIAGPKWVPPTEARQAEATAKGKTPAELIQDQIDEQERRLAAVEKAMGGDTSRRQPGGGGHGNDSREGAGGKSGGGASGGPAPRGGPKVDPKQKQNEMRREQITKKLTDLRRQLEKLDGGAGASDTSERGFDKPMLSDPAIRLWGHDASAEPGAVYRYRTRIIINNPLFSRTGLGDDAAGKLPVVYGQWSDWTEPVLVMPREVYFISSASPRSPINGTVSAGTEAYVFYYGYYRKGSASLEPGDIVRTVAKTPPNLMVYDEKKMAETQRPPVTGQPGRFREGEDSRRDPSEGFIPDGPGKSPATTPSEPGPTAPAPGIPGQDGAIDDLNGLLKPAKKEIPIFIADVFLDATSIAELAAGKAVGGLKGDAAAYFRSPSGDLTMRLPALERASTLYKLISASEAQGRTQGQPKPEEKKAVIPQTDSRRETPRDDGGAGGGGG